MAIVEDIVWNLRSTNAGGAEARSSFDNGALCFIFLFLAWLFLWKRARKCTCRCKDRSCSTSLTSPRCLTGTSVEASRARRCPRRASKLSNASIYTKHYTLCCALPVEWQQQSTMRCACSNVVLRRLLVPSDTVIRHPCLVYCARHLHAAPPHG